MQKYKCHNCKQTPFHINIKYQSEKQNLKIFLFAAIDECLNFQKKSFVYVYQILCPPSFIFYKLVSIPPFTKPFVAWSCFPWHYLRKQGTRLTYLLLFHFDRPITFTVVNIVARSLSNICNEYANLNCTDLINPRVFRFNWPHDWIYNDANGLS